MVTWITNVNDIRAVTNITAVTMVKKITEVTRVTKINDVRKFASFLTSECVSNVIANCMTSALFIKESDKDLKKLAGFVL